MKPVAILASGMVTAVGLNSASSCAAIRCAIDNFSETRFMDKGGEWIIGAQVPLDQPWRGLLKLVHMVVPAIQECLGHIPHVKKEQVALLLCVAEKERPGRIEGLDDRLLEEIRAALGTLFHPQTTVIAKGRVGGALALDLARRLIHDEHVPYCVIAGVDSYLTAACVAAYEDKGRLLTSRNSNGFIPGEAAAAILVGLISNSNGNELRCLGIGHGTEKATMDSEEPLRADGLVEAFRNAFNDAECGFEQVDYRLTDANGEQYWFKEAALGMTRAMRVRKENFFLWHPADCIGETGAATASAALAFAASAAQKRYAPGPAVLCHVGNDAGDRFALILREEGRTV